MKWLIEPFDDIMPYCQIHTCAKMYNCNNNTCKGASFDCKNLFTCAFGVTGGGRTCPSNSVCIMIYNT